MNKVRFLLYILYLGMSFTPNYKCHFSKCFLKRHAHQKYDSNLRNCINTLKTDIQYFPHNEFNWNIYTPCLEFCDHHGLQTFGLSTYKTMLQSIQLLSKILTNNIAIKYSIIYDIEHKKIVITWYSKWHTKIQLQPSYIDAISHFHLNNNGYIYKHELTRVLINKNNIGNTMNSILRFPSFTTNTPEVEPMLYSNESMSIQQPMSIQQCEYVWDCDNMECCDFILFKICCSNGIHVPSFYPEPNLVPIPIPVEPNKHPENILHINS